MVFDCIDSLSLHPYLLISGEDVDITPMIPYQPLPFHILSFAKLFQSIILIYALRKYLRGILLFSEEAGVISVCTIRILLESAYISFLFCFQWITYSELSTAVSC